MDKKHLFTLIITLFSLFLSSCDEEDIIAEELLYGGGKVTDTKVELSISLTRINGWYMLDNTQIYGLDVTIGNLNDQDIYSVSIEMKDIYPNGDVIELSEDDDLFIDHLPANSSLKPEFHWYVDDTYGTIYIGNVYVQLYGYVSAGNTYSIDFEVNFNIPGKGDFKINQTKSFTTISNLSDLPI